MCGPTRDEKEIAMENSRYAETTQANYSKLFGEQQETMTNLKDIFTPIAMKGPSQQGMSPEEQAALNTGIIDTTGANYANAARAVATQMAGRGGGIRVPASGVAQQIKAGLASAAAGTTAAEEMGVTKESYAMGRENWNRAVGGLDALAGRYDPTGAGNLGAETGKNAFDMAHTISEEQAQADSAIGGAIMGGVGMVTGGLSGLGGTFGKVMGGISGGTHSKR